VSVPGESPQRPRGSDPSATLTRGERRRSRQWFVVGAVAIVVVALFLRFYGLGSQSFWIDEINVASFVKSGHLFSDLRDRGGPYEPPLHYLTVLAALQLPFGFETAARIPSAVFGALEVLALILLTLEATRRRTTALVAGSLLAVAPFVVRYSQENRYYVMFSALVLLSWWLLLRALRLRTTWSWVWYGVTAAAMQLTHPFAPLVLVIEAGVVAVLAWRARKTDAFKPLVRGYVIAVLIGIILIIPWYAYGALDWVDGIRNGKRYGFNAKGSGYTVPIDRELFSRMGEWLLGNSRGLSVLVVVLVVLIVAAPFLARGRDRRTALFALAYTFGFMLVLIPLARTIGTYFAYRRIESLVPPLLLVAAIGIVALAERLVRLHLDRKVAFAIGAVVLAVVLGLSLAATIEYFGTEKSNYREMARIIRSTPADEDVVITANADPTRILEYLSWQGVKHPVTFVIKNDAPDFPASMKRVVWFTGASPDRDDMRTRALNDLEKMQIVAGDSSGPLAILPWFVSRSEPGSQAQLNDQAATVSRLPHLLPPP
jgi:4-amino-4-deoxy-L-arabinose transferase-like glycosyltransferase